MKHCIVFAMLLLAPLLHGADVPTEDFRLITATGKVAVIPVGETEPRAATAGLPLSQGDRVVTGEGGTAELATRAGTVIRLEEKSSLGLDDVRTGWTTFRLTVGRFLGKFQKSSTSRYRVKTPVAVASVRGTELALDVNDEGELNAGVVEGEVAIEAPDVEEALAIATSSATAVPETSSATWTEEVLTADQGVNVQPHARPSRLNEIPKPLRGSLAWFPAVRERVPQLRASLKDLDAPARLRLRQQSLRERIRWQAPTRPADRVKPLRDGLKGRPRPSRSPVRPPPSDR